MTDPCIARVLVVENDPEARKELVEVLTKPGLMVKAAEGQGPALQESAKQLASQFRPHVVVVDLRLVDDQYRADRSGLELMRDRSFASSRCVLHSAFLDEDYTVIREAFVELRVADVVGKKDSPQRLIDAVEKAARDGCICCREFSIQWPSSWDEKAIIRALFDEEHGLPSDVVIDILGHLFSDGSSVALKPLKGAAKASASVFRGRAVLFQAWADDKEPVVVKLAPRDRITKEVAAHMKYVNDHLVGLYYAQLQDHRAFWDLGGIRYSFIGSSQKSIETFAVFYQQPRASDDIITPLRHFFAEVWSRRYAETRKPLSGNLFDAYDSFLKLRQRLADAHDADEVLLSHALPSRYPSPLEWITEHEQESLVPGAWEAVTHGDVHGDNLFIEGEHAWAIDFERSGPGPILRDFVELEQDIVTRLVALPEGDLQLFHDLAITLTMPTSPDDSLLPLINYQNEEIMKCLEVIQGLRSIAREMTGFTDMREYYWGLLFDSAFTIMLADKSSQTWWRGFLFASILCARLEHWDGQWPPANDLPTP